MRQRIPVPALTHPVAVYMSTSNERRLFKIPSIIDDQYFLMVGKLGTQYFQLWIQVWQFLDQLFHPKVSPLIISMNKEDIKRNSAYFGALATPAIWSSFFRTWKLTFCMFDRKKNRCSGAVQVFLLTSSLISSYLKMTSNCALPWTDWCESCLQ